MSVDPRAFLDSTPLVPIALCPSTGQVAFVGPQACGHLGYPLETWLKPDFWGLTLFPDDQAAVVRARAAAAPGRVHSIDYRLEHANGRVVWTSEVLSLATDLDGGNRQLRGFLLDVTDRKRREVALWKSEERLRAMLRGAPDAMVITDTDGIIVDMNDQAEALADYRLAEIVGSSIDHLLPEHLRDRLADLRAAFERDRRRSLVDGHGLAIERSDGTEIPVEVSMSLVRSGKEPHHILCSIRDLTARRRVEAQLRTSERRLREMANVVPAMVCFVDGDSRYRFANDAYAAWLGWEPHHLEGRRVREVLGEARWAPMQAALDAALDGSERRYRIDVRDAAGRELPVDVSLVPQRDEGGEISGCFVVMLEADGGVAPKTDRAPDEPAAKLRLPL